MSLSDNHAADDYPHCVLCGAIAEDDRALNRHLDVCEELQAQQELDEAADELVQRSNEFRAYQLDKGRA